MTRTVSLTLFILLVLALPPAVALAAGPMFWDSPAKVPFKDGELRGAALDPAGSLVPGLVAAPVLADSSLVFWGAVAAGDGAIYVGSGHHGRIWRVDRHGQATLFADLPAEEVFGLLLDGDGLLAGCGPGGQVFAIDRRGQAVLRGTVPGGFVWDLERAGDGAVYLATGSPAAVYRLGGAGEPELVVELPASHALDLAVKDDGSLLVATQGPGRVFAVEPQQRSATLVLAMEQDEGRQILRGPDGWYALGFQADDDRGNPGGQGQGIPLNPFEIMVTADADIQPVRVALYSLDGVTPHRVFSSERGLTSMAWSDDHGWVGAGARQDGDPATLYALSLPNQQQPLATWEGGDVLELLVLGHSSQPDAILAVQAHPGHITRLSAAGRDEAMALGAPLDGRIVVRWGRLTWQGAAGGNEPRFAVRTGMSPSPDPTWSDWQDLDRGRDLDLGRLDASRSLQWRVTLPTGSRVDAVTVSAVAPNLPPQITLLELQPAGELLRGGMHQSAENVTQRLDSGLQIEYSTQRREDRRLDRDRAALLRPLRTVTWHARDPNEDRLVYRLFQRREGQTVWLPLAGPLTDQVFTWDTASLPDGHHELRLLASDRPSNPEAQALTSERILRRIPVDNTPPELSGWELRHHRDGFELKLEARDAFGPLAGAELVLPDGSTQRLDPVDGVCDSKTEKFAAVVAYPQAWLTAPPRPWTVSVRVWDLQGNLSTVTGVLP